MIDFIIFEELSSQSITLSGLILPSWRVPIFIVPFLKEEKCPLAVSFSLHLNNDGPLSFCLLCRGHHYVKDEDKETGRS